MSIPDETPLFIPDPDPDDEWRVVPRSRARQSRQGEWTPLWIVLGIAGLCGVGYAVHLALDAPTSVPPVTVPPAVVATPGATGSDDSFGDEYVRREALRHQRNERNKRDDARVREAAKSRQDSIVEHVREPDPPPLPPDDATSFENNAAFDRPAMGNVRPSRRAEFSDRPNQPNPSFGKSPEVRP
jgi:hypothetical protein